MKWMRSLLILIAAVCVLWLIGQAVGFQISIVGSILLSIALTILVNLLLRVFRPKHT